MTDETIKVAYWHGCDGPIGRAWCSYFGWREVVWRRDPERGWIEDSATIQHVIEWPWDQPSRNYVLSDPRPCALIGPK